MATIESLADVENSSNYTTRVPKTDGAANPTSGTAKSPAADRNLGQRQAGTTHRPTDKPIGGGDRG
jgi:hypothetical protein